ncbi:unnamed protein product [Darwinula stevensoni]|uniref:Signal transducer and transcription activator n=1 Tax=Darwinula stevensoni TaxID=69355 RepID=A0A7R8X9Y8_9CRUS|nr:unnamed protein product [Darwinula stevensoni]CAG0889472.1 unnamed protein product [Darwinula stevensoni]
MQMGANAPGIWYPDRMTEIQEMVSCLRQLKRETHIDLRIMEREQESFHIQYNQYDEINRALNFLQSREGQQGIEANILLLQTQNAEMQHSLQQKVAAIEEARRAYWQKQLSNFQRLQALLEVVDSELVMYKREQQLAGNGTPITRSLDQIQIWFEGLAEHIWEMRQQITAFQRLRESSRFQFNDQVIQVDSLASEVTALLSTLITKAFVIENQPLSTLITKAFVIENQPPQVVKTGTKFAASIRLLVGGKLNIHMISPQVTASIVSEAQARQLYQRDNPPTSRIDTCGEILNNKGTMEYHPSRRHLIASFSLTELRRPFRSMQLRRIRRTERRGNESVTDEKFALLFQTSFKIAGDVPVEVWALSLPVVVIVGGAQELNAWATVSWDNAFAEAGRAPFDVPDHAPWSKVAEMLNAKFMSACGRSLTEDNLRFLAAKAFRSRISQDYNSLSLTWNQFCKEPLQDRSFTFWEWFHQILKLTQRDLSFLWNDGWGHGIPAVDPGVHREGADDGDPAAVPAGDVPSQVFGLGARRHQHFHDHQFVWIQ